MDRPSLLKKGSLSSLGSSMRRGLGVGSKKHKETSARKLGTVQEDSVTANLSSSTTESSKIVVESRAEKLKRKASKRLTRKDSSRSSKKRYNRDGLFCSASPLENALIMDKLGINEDGYCMRHFNQAVLASSKNSNFEQVLVCRICLSETQAQVVTKNRNSLSALGKVIHNIASLQSDKQEWRARTNILYHGNKDHTESSDDDDDELSITPSEEDNHDIPLSDDDWKDGLVLRMKEVRIWNESLALQKNPIYQGYYMKLNIGVPLEAVKTMCQADGNLPWILDLDRTQPLSDQIPSDKDINDATLQKILKAQENGTSLQDQVSEIVSAFERRKKQDEQAAADGLIETNKSKSSRKLVKGLSKKLKRSIGGALDDFLTGDNSKDAKLQIVVSGLVQDINEKEKTIQFLKETLLETNQAMQELHDRVQKLEEAGTKAGGDDAKAAAKTIVTITTTTSKKSSGDDDLKTSKHKRESKMSSTRKKEDDAAILKTPKKRESKMASSKKRESKLEKKRESKLEKSTSTKAAAATVTDVKKAKSKTTKTVKTTKRSKSKKKDNEEPPNLDPAHLRAVFRQRVKKLVAVNKFFTATALQAFDAQNDVVKKRFTQSKNAQKKQQPVRESILTSPSESNISKRRLRGKKFKWSRDDQLEHVRTMDKVYDDEKVRAICFYTNEEIKLFRFEKFMEEHADEFEIVDDSEEEWDEEEIIEEEIIEEVIYDSEEYEMEEIAEGDEIIAAVSAGRRLSC